MTAALGTRRPRVRIRCGSWFICASSSPPPDRERMVHAAAARPSAGNAVPARKPWSCAAERNRPRTRAGRRRARSRVAATCCSPSTWRRTASYAGSCERCGAPTSPSAPTASTARRATASAANRNRSRAEHARTSAALTASGASASASPPPRSTGRARTPAAAAATRSSATAPPAGPRNRSSTASTAPRPRRAPRRSPPNPTNTRAGLSFPRSYVLVLPAYGEPTGEVRELINAIREYVRVWLR